MHSSHRSLSMGTLLVSLPATRLDRLQRVQNAAARLITGAKRRESITPYLRSLHWLPIKQRIDFKIAVLVFKSLHSHNTSLSSFDDPVPLSSSSSSTFSDPTIPIIHAPSYLSDCITPYIPSRNLRSDSAHRVVPYPVRSTKKNYGDRAFSVAGPLIWNSLPLSVRSSSSLTQFRSRLKTHLFHDAYANR